MEADRNLSFGVELPIPNLGRRFKKRGLTG
jgi:hypothetical protein